MIFTNKWRKIAIHLTQFFYTYYMYIPFVIFSHNYKNKFGKMK